MPTIASKLRGEWANRRCAPQGCFWPSSTAPIPLAPGRPPEREKISASGHAWLALLAQTQASRDLLALAIGGQTQAFVLLQAQALANRDAAAALLHAMRMHRDPRDHAPMPDELHCWYGDAREIAATASHAVKAVAAQPVASCVFCVHAGRYSDAGKHRQR